MRSRLDFRRLPGPVFDPPRRETTVSHSQQTIKQNAVFPRTLEFRLVSPRPRNRLAMRWIKEAGKEGLSVLM